MLQIPFRSVRRRLFAALDVHVAGEPSLTPLSIGGQLVYRTVMLEERHLRMVQIDGCSGRSDLFVATTPARRAVAVGLNAEADRQLGQAVDAEDALEHRLAVEL